MKKVLLVVCAMLLACSCLSMAELSGDQIQWDIAYAPQSYEPGDVVRAAILGINPNPAGQALRIYHQMMDPMGNVSQGVIQRMLPAYWSGTLNYGKPLPLTAWSGLYTWTANVKARLPDGTWQDEGTKSISFFVGDQGSGAPGTVWEFFSSLYPDEFAKGESFTQSAMVGNGTEGSATVQVQTYITSPSGHEYLLGPQPLTVEAMSNATIRFVITPNLDAPSGAYTVLQQLLDMENEVLSEVATGFSITGSSFNSLYGDGLLALAEIPEENKLDPEYDVAADLDNVLTLFNAGDVQGALAQADAIIAYLPEKFTTAVGFAPAMAVIRDYLEASLNSGFTYSLN